MYNQTVPDLPPLIKEKVPVLKIASQVAIITQVSPRIDTEWNARCSRQLSVTFSIAQPESTRLVVADCIVVGNLHSHLKC